MRLDSTADSALGTCWLSSSVTLLGKLPHTISFSSHNNPAKSELLLSCHW